MTSDTAKKKGFQPGFNMDRFRKMPGYIWNIICIASLLLIGVPVCLALFALFWVAVIAVFASLVSVLAGVGDYDRVVFAVCAGVVAVSYVIGKIADGQAKVEAKLKEMEAELKWNAYHAKCEAEGPKWYDPIDEV